MHYSFSKTQTAGVCHRGLFAYRASSHDEREFVCCSSDSLLSSSRGRAGPDTRPSANSHSSVLRSTPAMKSVSPDHTSRQRATRSVLVMLNSSLHLSSNSRLEVLRHMHVIWCNAEVCSVCNDYQILYAVHWSHITVPTLMNAKPSQYPTQLRQKYEF